MAKFTLTFEPPCTERYARWCWRRGKSPSTRFVRLTVIIPEHKKAGMRLLPVFSVSSDQNGFRVRRYSFCRVPLHSAFCRCFISLRSWRSFCLPRLCQSAFFGLGNSAFRLQFGSGSGILPVCTRFYHTGENRIPLPPAWAKGEFGYCSRFNVDFMIWLA